MVMINPLLRTEIRAKALINTSVFFQLRGGYVHLPRAVDNGRVGLSITMTFVKKLWKAENIK